MPWAPKRSWKYAALAERPEDAKPWTYTTCLKADAGNPVGTGI